jgi:hypothetical protein
MPNSEQKLCTSYPNTGVLKLCDIATPWSNTIYIYATPLPHLNRSTKSAVLHTAAGPC